MDSFDLGLVMPALGAPATPVQRAGDSKHGRIAEAIAMDAPCWLCGVGLGQCTVQECSAMLGVGQITHKICYNACHSADRILASVAETMTPELAAQIKSLKQSDEVKYKSISMALRAEHRTRTPAQRQQCKQYVEELVSESRASRIEKQFLLTKTQYIAWHGLHEGMDKETASQQWDQDMQDPSVYKEHDPANPLKIWIAVKAPIELQLSRSVAQKRSFQQISSGLDSSELNSAMQRALVPDSNVMDLTGSLPGAAALTSSRSMPSVALPSGVAGASSLGIQLPAGLRASRPKAAAPPPKEEPKKEPKKAPKEEPGDEFADVEETADQVEGEITLDMGLQKMSLPKFLTYKKQLKEKFQALLKTNMSSAKGRTHAQFLGDLLHKDSQLAQDEAIKELGHEDVSKKATSVIEQCKTHCDKKITTLRFSDVKKETEWKAFLDTTFQLADQGAEAISEIQQLVGVVRDVKHGLKSQRSQAKRAESYRQNKVAKGFLMDGYPDELAKHMGKVVYPFCTGEATDDIDLPKFDGTFARLALMEPDSTQELAVVMKRMAEENEREITRDRVSLLPRMTGSSLLVRNKYSKQHFNIDGLMGASEDDVYIPWLVMSQQFANTWGPQRWPLPGVPACVHCLSTHMVIGIVQNAVMIEKGITLETGEWFGTEKTLSERDVTVVVLKKGQGLFVPFGHTVFFSFVDKEKFDKKGEKPTGAALIMHVLPKVISTPDPVKADFAHSTRMFLNRNGADAPWKNVKAGCEAWLLAHVDPPRAADGA